MSSCDFEIKILKPYLDRITSDGSKYRITLIDGSQYFLGVDGNIRFQRYMVEMAKNKL
jgi:hypothetical protein